MNSSSNPDGTNRKTHVRYLFSPGHHRSTLEEVVQSRDLADLRVQRRVIGFFFYDVEQRRPERMDTLLSCPLNVSGIYYYCCYRVSKECGLVIAKKNGQDVDTLINQMLILGADRMVVSRDGYVYPFRTGVDQTVLCLSN